MKWKSIMSGLCLLASASAVWAQGIIHVNPQPQPYYTLPTLHASYMVLDINGDGVVDFALNSGYPLEMSEMISWLIPQNGNLIATTDNGWVANLAVGDMVGADMASQYGWSDTQSSITSITITIIGSSEPTGGSNFSGQDGYIGFDLVQGGNNYYGWMHVYSPMNDASSYGVITEWAYSTVPNMPIMVGQVPEPGTLGLLGLGGLTFFILRRKAAAMKRIHSPRRH